MQAQQTQYYQNALMCSPCNIQGPVTFGKGCVVQQYASIIADKDCPIAFGDYNIIEEKSYITNKGIKRPDGKYTPSTMTIGSYNLFEIGTMIDSSNIGNFNKFEHRSYVENNCTIKNGCTLGALSKLISKSTLESSNCLYGTGRIVPNANFIEQVYKETIVSLQELLVSKATAKPKK